MSACPLLERVSIINGGASAMETHLVNEQNRQAMMGVPVVPQGGPGPGPGPGGGSNMGQPLDSAAVAAAVAAVTANSNGHDGAVPHQPPIMLGQQPPQPLPQIPSSMGSIMYSQAQLERDYYGCYCLKFIVKNGTHITEEKVLADFGEFGEVVDVRGPGLFSGLRGNHVYVRFIDRSDAEDALRNLTHKYHQLTPASISDVLPDNYGLYTISFYNKTGIPSAEVRREFSKFGEVKNLTGSLDVKGGRVFVSYKEKASAVQALQAFFFRKDRYPNMKFALPRCEKDYFGCYCLKFYNKSGDITEEKVLADFGQFGDVVDVRGPGLFDVTGDDVYVRYKEKSSAEQALIELVGKYDSLCLAPPSDIQADKFGYFTITFVNDKCLSKSDVWYIFSKFGTVACVNGTFDCKKGRVFVSYKEKQGALTALETMLITKEYHLQVSKNSTVRKNDYNVIGGGSGGQGGNSGPKDAVMDLAVGDFAADFAATQGLLPIRGDKMSMPPPAAVMPGVPPTLQQQSLVTLGGMVGMNVASGTDNPRPMAPHHKLSMQHQQPPPLPHHLAAGHHPRDHSRSREPPSLMPSASAPVLNHVGVPPPGMDLPNVQQPPGPHQGQQASQAKFIGAHHPSSRNNGMVKFNRNVEKDIFGYFCLSFLNEDGDINEKKVRHDFGKFGEVVSVRGALGKQKGHVFVRFRRKEAAENCLNCLNSFPLSEMSELFGKYLFLSPATPRDIDCDMYGLYSISFLNLNMKTFREIRQEFSKFGEIVRCTSGGGGNTDELVSVSYAEKHAAVMALQAHFTNKEFPYLDIAKGSSLLLVNSSDSSDNEDNESDYIVQQHRQMQRHAAAAAGHAAAGLHPGQQHARQSAPSPSDPFHDPPVMPSENVAGNSVVDELLKPFQSYFNIYRTGQYHSSPGQHAFAANASAASPPDVSPTSGRSPDKKYRIKSVRQANGVKQNNHHPHPHHAVLENGLHSATAAARPNFSVPPPTTSVPPPPTPTRQTMVTDVKEASSDSACDPPPPLPVHQSLSAAVSPTSSIAPDIPAPTSPPQSSSAIVSESADPAEQDEAKEQAVAYQDASKRQALLSKECPTDQNSDTRDSVVQEPVSPERIQEAAEKQLPSYEELLMEPDFLGFYSLAFNRSKDISERRIRLDFGPDVALLRGLLAPSSSASSGNGASASSSSSSSGGNEAGSVIVSFSSREAALASLTDESLVSKYLGLSPAPSAKLQSDRDGAFSVEFMNSGMRLAVTPNTYVLSNQHLFSSGIREITNEFSQHGEVVKVMAGGAKKDAVKRVTVSYAERRSAVEAVVRHAGSKDYVAVDFSRECLLEMTSSSKSPCRLPPSHSFSPSAPTTAT